jgi:hypothetical protein
MQATRNYKDSVFTLYFEEKSRLIELYNAVTGKNVPEDAEIELTTLKGVLYRDRMNDICFLLDGKLVVLIEAQAVPDPNMPLRMLEYTAREYELIVPQEKRYTRRLTKIPKPEFLVLYNGKEPLGDLSELKLSDAYHAVETKTNGLLELIVPVYNINEGHNEEILKRSKALMDYAVFIAKVREHLAKEELLDTAVE